MTGMEFSRDATVPPDRDVSFHEQASKTMQAALMDFTDHKDSESMSGESAHRVEAMRLGLQCALAVERALRQPAATSTNGTLFHY
jgi:hypothetical protein